MQSGLSVNYLFEQGMEPENLTALKNHFFCGSISSQ
jgi:hypothetical protein